MFLAETRFFDVEKVKNRCIKETSLQFYSNDRYFPFHRPKTTISTRTSPRVTFTQGIGAKARGICATVKKPDNYAPVTGETITGGLNRLSAGLFRNQGVSYG